ncbi:MAG: DNA polymerase III subunit delta [Bacteroidales bacterium]|nr:DNA polymerase III subunit delta [Bacteroidales bacterium]
MAKQEKANAAQQCKALIEEAKAGVFKPVYLLMGDEPYYPDLLCKAILDNCIDEFGKDFNETVCYGADVNAEQVITAARRFPMMADRQLVVVKEAQLMKDLEQLSVYCESPLDSTVLVILMHGAGADKRKSLYKAVKENGVVLESNALRDYELARWIGEYYASRGLNIDPRAAALLGESTGTDLSRIAAETDKLLKNLPEGTKNVGVADIEKNVGISREFSVFELTKELFYRNGPKALKIAARIGDGARFAMPMAVSMLYVSFYKLLKYHALLQSNPYPSPDEKGRLLGNPYFFREYDAAAHNYGMKATMAIMALLCEYDYLGKGGDGGATSQGELLVELVVKILSL